MPLTPINRLLFAQGGLCFFCSTPLTKEDATVEHLDAKAHGGSNADKNCVACCSEINALLGSMSLKEKIRVILNQNGKFVCPKSASRQPNPTAKLNTPTTAETISQFSIVVADLEKRGTSKPKRVESLKNTIRRVATVAAEPLTEPQLDLLIDQLQRNGIIQISGIRVSYSR